MKALIAIDLKIGEFDAAFKGEMELYLAYLAKNETIEGENLPIGLILCAGKNPEHIELMQLAQSNIKVAEYLTLLTENKYCLTVCIALFLSQKTHLHKGKSNKSEKV